MGLPNTKNLLCKFPCLLNLQPANLDWSASFFGLSFSSMYGSQFQITLRKLLRFQTNTWISGLTVLDFNDSSLKIFHHFLATIVSNWKSVCFIVPLPPTSAYTHCNILVFSGSFQNFLLVFGFQQFDCDVPTYGFSLC